MADVITRVALVLTGRGFGPDRAGSALAPTKEAPHPRPFIPREKNATNSPGLERQINYVLDDQKTSRWDFGGRASSEFAVRSSSLEIRERGKETVREEGQELERR